MNGILKKSVAIGLSVAGSVIGVGFASGREVFAFFAKYGFVSIIFCFIASVLFGLFSYIVFNNDNQTENMHKKEKCKREVKNVKNEQRMRVGLKNISNNLLFDVVLVVVLFIISSAMFAGVDGIFSMIGVSGFLLLVIKVVLGMFIFFYLCTVKRGVFIINGFLSVLLIIVIIIVFVVAYGTKEVDLIPKEVFSYKTVCLPILYVAMNFFVAYPLVENLSLSLYNKKEKVLSSIFVGVNIFVPLCVVCLSILFFGGSMLNSNMIMFDMARGMSGVLGWFYFVVILLGLISTLMSTTYGIIKILKKQTRFCFNSRIWLFAILFASFSLSFLGFGNIIDVCYPFVGGACVCVLVLKFWYFKKCKNA